MPKKKRPEEKPEEQFKRFVETANALDVESKDAEHAFKKIAAPTREKSGRLAELRRK